MESVNRRFSPEKDEGGIGLSEDLLGGSGDSWGFADEGYQGILIYTQVPQ